MKKQGKKAKAQPQNHCIVIQMKEMTEHESQNLGPPRLKTTKRANRWLTQARTTLPYMEHQYSQKKEMDQDSHPGEDLDWWALERLPLGSTLKGTLTVTRNISCAINFTTVKQKCVFSYFKSREKGENVTLSLSMFNEPKRASAHMILLLLQSQKGMKVTALEYQTRG